MSPAGRKIQEDVFKVAQLSQPVKIGILETPTGFEVNAINSWPARMKTFFEKSLANFKPQVTMIRAWRSDGEYSTNDPKNASLLSQQDCLYCGAGSPGYAINHLKDSLVWKELLQSHKSGMILSLGSATAVAVGSHALPVYEIFKAGHDLFWLAGLDLFSLYDLDLTIIPHWNNQEGEDFDTSRCWMGVERFNKLYKMLPPETVIAGIDEQTALLFDTKLRSVRVVGIGSITILKRGKEKVYPKGAHFSFRELQ